MPRFTKLETEALISACTEILSGDVVEYMNLGYPVSDPPKTPEEKRAIKLAKALDTALGKLSRSQKSNTED